MYVIKWQNEVGDGLIHLSWFKLSTLVVYLNLQRDIFMTTLQWHLRSAFNIAIFSAAYRFSISTGELNVFVMSVIILYIFRCESIFRFDTVKSTFLVLFLLWSVRKEYFISYYFLSSLLKAFINHKSILQSGIVCIWRHASFIGLETIQAF